MTGLVPLRRRQGITQQRLIRAIPYTIAANERHEPPQETHRSRPPPRCDQRRVGAGKVYPPRPSEHSPPLLGAEPPRRRALGHLRLTALHPYYLPIARVSLRI